MENATKIRMITGGSPMTQETSKYINSSNYMFAITCILIKQLSYGTLCTRGLFTTFSRMVHMSFTFRISIDPTQPSFWSGLKNTIGLDFFRNSPTHKLASLPIENHVRSSCGAPVASRVEDGNIFHCDQRWRRPGRDGVDGVGSSRRGILRILFVG